VAQLSSFPGDRSSAFFLKFALPIAALVHVGLLLLPRPPEAPIIPKTQPESVEVDLSALPEIKPSPSPIAKPIVPPPVPLRSVPLQAAVTVPAVAANQSQQVQQTVAESTQSQPVVRDRIANPPLEKSKVAEPESSQSQANPQKPQNNPPPQQTQLQTQLPSTQPLAKPIVATGTDAFTQLGAVSCGQNCFQMGNGQTFQDFEQVMTQRSQVILTRLCNEEGHRIGYVLRNAKQQVEYWEALSATGTAQTMINQYVQRSELVGQPCE
jgi:hypothetical protein